jgi:hypothetical protein
MTTDTPRTDANQAGWEYHRQYGWHDSLAQHDPKPWPDFARELERENAELQSANTRFEKAFVRIAKAHGINSPLVLIGMAQNDEENFAEILARRVEEAMSNVPHQARRAGRETVCAR